MSTAVLPTLVGLTYPIARKPIWDTKIQEAISGKETRGARQSYPRYQWSATYNLLRSDANAEFQSLIGFYNARQGSFDSWLYSADDDNSVTSQAIGTGDGTTTVFPLVRSLGGFAEPVLAPNVVTNVKNNGSTLTLGTDYTVSAWGTSTPGVINFTSAPAAGHTLTSTFTYYWPCRFDQDQCEFALFMSQGYSVKTLTWKSLKN